MNILITGVAGFIGFNFSNNLLKKNKNIKIIGIDNLNSYYSTALKKKRLQYLKNNRNFKFLKVDLKDKNKLLHIFTKYKFTEVYNFAAQAGVRYSSINPDAYITSNIVGFSNIIFLCMKNKVKKLFYASSSSIYGDVSKYPIKENVNLDPKNLYGLTKKYNEELAKFYFENFNYSSIGLRFFTVFGEWGRPDMFIYKLLNAAYKGKKFNLNNNGNHYRDFTYIFDVITILSKLRIANLKKGFHTFNICSNKPLGLNKIIKFYKNKIPKTKIILKPKLPEDIFKTHGDNRKIKKIIKKLKFTDTKLSLDNTLRWFKKNHKMFN